MCEKGDLKDVEDLLSLQSYSNWSMYMQSMYMHSIQGLAIARAGASSSLYN